MADKNRIRYASPGECGADTGNPRSGAPLDTRHIAFLELFNSQVQYVVPRWQRRYCWGQSDIERLVDDLVTVAQVPAGSQAAHYGGTMLTFPESRAVQPVTVHRVVDGQQRLTTVSILLACIAEALGPEDFEWSASGSESTTIPNRSSKA